VNYLDELAEAIRREVAPPAASKEDARALFRLYAVLALAKGETVTDEDVHNAWAAWISDRRPDHEAIMPYRELAPDMQRKDQPFVDAIRRTMAMRRAAAADGLGGHPKLPRDEGRLA
jgi:hypothetical protein